jgi:SpoVK/Ycf46/Vps4 family AAA+-type ATPase
MDDRRRFEQLLRARYPCIVAPTYDEERVMALIREVALESSRDLRIWSYSQGVHDGLLENDRGVKDTEPPAAGLYYMLSNPAPGITVLMDIIEHLSEARVLRLLRDLIDRQRTARGHVVLVDHKTELPEVIAHDTVRFEMSLPDERELEELIRSVVRRENAEQKVEARVSASALKTIVRNLRGLSRRQAEQILVHVITEDRRFNDADINRIVAHKRQILHKDGLLEYIESLATLDEIAGLVRLKEWLRHRERAMADDAAQLGLNPPRGILMLGVPGAGKSLCAKAVAAAWHRPLLRLDPSVLYDRYIGESERRLRDALRQAEAMSPIVLWIDEIEKGFSSAASHSVDGGLSRRMFGTMLTWMQEHTAPVFLIATANDIQALPAELLRKGRFDEIFFIDLPTREARRAIFQIHLTRRKQACDQFDLEALADASHGYTGAEIEQAIVSAVHGTLAGGRALGTADVLSAICASPPLSVTMREYIQSLRDWAAGRCVPAD